MATFPANSFYRSFYFDFDVEEKDTNSFSRTYKLHNRFTPVHKNFNIKIFADSVTSGLSNKVYISYSPDNSEFQYMKTKHDGNYLTSKSRQLGYYKVMLDTTPPLITEINFHNGKKINNQHNLKIKIEDTQTGISEYRARLNDKWVLMEYDKKNNLLTYNFDERLLKGKNEFKLIVIDMLDNVSEYNCELIY
ncbi:MAG: hypothetical protein H8E34_02820 [Bacteroidetes bacterium]|nr:hypothetical protein [Bacteroidota bacterium]